MPFPLLTRIIQHTCRHTKTSCSRHSFIFHYTHTFHMRALTWDNLTVIVYFAASFHRQSIFQTFFLQPASEATNYTTSLSNQLVSRKQILNTLARCMCISKQGSSLLHTKTITMLPVHEALLNGISYTADTKTGSVKTWQITPP